MSVGPPPFKANSRAQAVLAYHAAGSEPSMVHAGKPIAVALSAHTSTPDCLFGEVSKAI